MDVQISGGPKALYQGDGAGLRINAIRTRLFDEKDRDGAVDNA